MHIDPAHDPGWRAAADACRARIADVAPVVAVVCGPASEEDRAYYACTPPHALSAFDLETALVALGVRSVDVVDITRVPQWLDRLAGVDLAVINLHGSPGEDGTIQRALDARSIRFVGSGEAASVVALDKGATKRLALAAGVPTPAFLRIVDGSADAPSTIVAGARRICKPLRGGSSLHARLLGDDEPLPATGDWIVEEFLAGHDVTVTVCERDGAAHALPAIVLSHRRPFYDAKAKLVRDPAAKAVASRPAQLAAALAACEALAVTMHEAVGAAHVTRSDFVVHGGRPFYLETNTLPGMSVHSNVAECARAAGLGHGDLIALVVGAALVGRAPLADDRRTSQLG